MATQLEKDGKIGTLTIRQNEVEMRAYIQFEDGSDDTKVYPKDETEEYIIQDLVDNHSYQRITMKKYYVRATMSVELEVEIEASSKEKAWKIAKQTDGGDFTEIENSNEWNIHDVYEKSEEESA